MGVTRNWLDVSGTIHNCPRCGYDHANLKVNDLTSPIVDPTPACPSNPCMYHKWAMCPVNNQPILFRLPATSVLVPQKPDPKQVENLAERLWKLDGCPNGRDKHHWKVAEYALTTYLRIPVSDELRALSHVVDDLLKSSENLIDEETAKELERYVSKHLKK